MAKGGSRPGAGRPRGALSKTTIEKKAMEALLHQRILGAVDRLFNAQLRLAEGAAYLYQIVETGTGKDKKQEHVLITDPQDIKNVLDELGGMESGVVDEGYYYISTKPADNKAIDSMLDRVFGKATQVSELTGKNGGPIKIQGVEIAIRK